MLELISKAIFIDLVEIVGLAKIVGSAISLSNLDFVKWLLSSAPTYTTDVDVGDIR